MTALATPEAIEIVAPQFADGNYDYLPFITRDSMLAQFGINDNTAGVEIYPADILPELPDKIIEHLAQSNLRSLYDDRGSNPNYQRGISLFAPISLSRRRNAIGDTAIKLATVSPSNKILGRISGSNRKMLQIVLDELGVKGDPTTDREELKARVFGRPLDLNDPSVPAQVHTHSRYKVSWVSNFFVSPYLFRRSHVDEIEIAYSEGQVESVVQFNL